MTIPLLKTAGMVHSISRFHFWKQFNSSILEPFKFYLIKFTFYFDHFEVSRESND